MKLIAALATCLVSSASCLSAEPLDLVKRAIPFVHGRGLDWITNRECASCHQVPSMLWTMNRAADAGVAMDRVELDELTEWAADWGHWNQTGRKDGEAKVSAGNIDTMAFLLLGRDKKDVSPGEWVVKFRSSLLANQQTDGSWNAGGQLPLGKRPLRETTEVTTMWTLVALNETGDEPLPEETRTRANDFLARPHIGVSTEWHALRLILAPDNEGHLRKLLDLQREDGSWGWIASEPGDAFGTGLALYSLARAGLPGDHEARRQAIKFLEKTQQKDGSWPVPSTRKKDANRISETATDWGTAWACIALLEGMPAP